MLRKLSNFASELKEGYNLVKDAINPDLFKSFAREAAISVGIPIERLPNLLPSKKQTKIITYSCAAVLCAGFTYRILLEPTCSLVASYSKGSCTFKLDDLGPFGKDMAQQMYSFCHISKAACQRYLKLNEVNLLLTGSTYTLMAINAWRILPGAQFAHHKISEGILYVKHNGIFNALEISRQKLSQSAIQIYRKLLNGVKAIPDFILEPDEPPIPPIEPLPLVLPQIQAPRTLRNPLMIEQKPCRRMRRM